MRQKYRVQPKALAKLVAATVDAVDARALRQQALDYLARVVGFDEGYLLPFSNEFFALAPPYMTSFVASRVYAPDLGRAIEVSGGSGSYIDTEVYSARERDALPLYRDLLRPAGVRSQIVALLRHGGRTGGVIHLNRSDPRRPFRPRDLERAREVVRVVAMLHAAVEPAAGSDMESAATLVRGLSPRQFEIALLIAEGCQNAQAAARLALSERTVRNQMSAIFERLAVYSRAELALLFERAGFLQPSGSAGDGRRLGLLLRSVASLPL